MVDGRIAHDRILQSLLALFHRLEGDILRRLGLGDDQSGILLGKEPLRNGDVEISGERDRGEHHHHRDQAMPEHDLEARLVDMKQRIKAALEHAV